LKFETVSAERHSDSVIFLLGKKVHSDPVFLFNTPQDLAPVDLPGFAAVARKGLFPMRRGLRDI
jgi:hypothetical protein